MLSNSDATAIANFLNGLFGTSITVTQVEEATATTANLAILEQLADAIGAGVALLVKMKIDQAEMKVTAASQAKDINELKTGQNLQNSKLDAIQITLAKMDGFAQGKAEGRAQEHAAGV